MREEVLILIISKINILIYSMRYNLYLTFVLIVVSGEKKLSFFVTSVFVDS